MRLSTICLALLAGLALVTVPAFGQQSGQGQSGARQQYGAPAYGTQPAPSGAESPSGAVSQSAPGLSPQQLGPPSYVVVGQVQRIDADHYTLSVTTDHGNQPLDITAQTVIRDNENNPIKLSDISQGDRVLAAFHRTAGMNVATQVFKMH